MSSDRRLTDHIEALVEEEQKLLAAEQHDAADSEKFDADRHRLAQIAVELDKSWDLLRQRRALRDAGGNPDDAHIRNTETVEHYQQ